VLEIVKPGTKIDFLGKWKIAVAISLGVLLLGAIGVPTRGFRLGVDFAGGSEVQVRFTDEAPVGEGAIREVMGDLGIENASVVRVGEGNEFQLKFKGERRIEVAPEEAEAAPADPRSGGEITARTDRIIQLETALAERVGPLEVSRVDFVGPKVGAELREDGLAALGIACLLILAYIAFRFTPRYAPGAVVALVHDVGVTAAVWVLLGLEFDLRVLAALLAVLGYSLNDTIIVYDRIRENLELHTKSDLVDVLNRSVNETLSRTLLTSITTMMAVLSLLFLGGEVVRPFALAMAIGILVGTYSSVYVAAPTLLWLERRYGAQTVPAKALKRGEKKR
jgi:preprotein translocase subunit SecF